MAVGLFPFGALPVAAVDTFTEGYYTYTVFEDYDFDIGNVACIVDCGTAISGDVVIPSALGGYPVAEIGEYAFADCADVTKIVLPDSVRYIWKYAFSGCTGLTEINVDENNPNCKSVDGVLFSKDMKTPVWYPAGKTDAAYTIPDGVTAIDIGAFYGCTSLTSVTISDCVEDLEYSNGIAAFDGCENLTIYCYAGSAAHAYAIGHGIPFVLLAETGSDPNLDIDGEAGLIRPEAGTTSPRRCWRRSAVRRARIRFPTPRGVRLRTARSSARARL